MKKTEEPVTLKQAETQELLHELLVRLGEDPERDGLLRTPERMERALQYLTRGYHQDAEKILKDALFTVSYDEMVIVKDRKSTRLNSSHIQKSRMPSSA